MKSKYSFLYILACLLLVSCDPIMELNLSINNQSEKELIVEFKAIQNSNFDTTFTIVSGGTKTILSRPSYGKAKQYDCCPCEVWDLKIITKDSSGLVVKDYKNKDNWGKSIKEKQRVLCQFVVNDWDIE
jgi:hypothetical protein